MGKRGFLARAIDFLISAVKLTMALAVGAVTSAALVYCFPSAPLFLWGTIALGGLAAFSSLGVIGFSLLEGERRVVLVLLSFWLVMCVYLDMMRYLALAWSIQLDETTWNVVSFPRYFVIHAKYFFRDLWTVTTGSSPAPPIVVLPDPPPPVARQGTPWFAVTQYVYDFTQNVFMNIVSSIIFAIMVVLWNRKR